MQRTVRNTVVPLAGRLAPVQRRTVRRISHTGVAYPASPLTRPDGGQRRSGPRPGARVPDLEVTGCGGRTRLHEVLRLGRHVLMVPGGDPPPWARRWPDQVVVVTTADSRAGRDLCLVMVVKSAHVYETERGYLRGVLAGAG